MRRKLPPLVSADWLASELEASDLLVLDATLFLPAHGRDARAEYEAAHIPGAVFMDLKRFQPLPELERLRAMLMEFGVGEGVRAVAYDNSPLRSAARGWWLLRHAGLEAAVLDGGLGAWRRDGHPTAGGPAPRARLGSLGPKPPAVHAINKAELLRSAPAQLLDARSGPRFRGEEAEPRPDVAPGHIPSSRNLPYGELFRPDGTYKSPGELRAVLESAGVNPAEPMVATCGSGVTACNIVLAAEILGNRDVRLYDGSWTEWGADTTTPKAVGPA